MRRSNGRVMGQRRGKMTVHGSRIRNVGMAISMAIIAPIGSISMHLTLGLVDSEMSEGVIYLF